MVQLNRILPAHAPSGTGRRFLLLPVSSRAILLAKLGIRNAAHAWEVAETDMGLDDVRTLAAAGESETVEFKKSTATLARTGETLCGFLSGQGGCVLVGVTPGGKVVGQQVSDSTLRDVAVMIEKFEPPVDIRVDRISTGPGKEVLVLSTPEPATGGPFTWGGRALPADRHHNLGYASGAVQETSAGPCA